jgi:hypothetical protein
VSVGIVFSHIVAILGHRFVGGKFLQPNLVIVVKPGFVVID